MNYHVVKIIDGDTFEVTPHWEFQDKTGNEVRPTGYNTPERGEPGYEEAKEKLTRLLLDNYVELKNPIGLSYDRLLCDVIYEGKNLADWFPEYK